LFYLQVLQVGTETHVLYSYLTTLLLSASRVLCNNRFNRLQELKIDVKGQP